MCKRKILILICLLFVFISSVCVEGNHNKPLSSQKQVYTDYELGVNYIVHMYTLADAGFHDENYIAKYGNFLTKADREFLRNNASLFSFSQQDRGPFAFALYFVPAQFNFKSRTDYKEYFNAWNKAIKTKSFKPLEVYSDSGITEYQSLFAMNEKAWQENVLSLQPAFQRLGEIFTNNFEKYQKVIWPEVRPILAKKSCEINQQLLKLDIIPSWEKLTGYSLGDNSYCISLFYAGRYGPSFNDTSSTKNTAFYDLDQKHFIDMISHEVGIHILFTHINKLVFQYQQEIPKIENPYIYGNVSYMASESLAAFYNQKVLKRNAYDVYCINDPLAFAEIYERLYNQGLPPDEIYRQGVLEYISHWTDPKAITARYLKFKAMDTEY
jgi:hypothetical protein